MHTVIKRLLAKDLLTGKEMAILQLANWIDTQLGKEGISYDIILPKLKQSSLHASEEEYKKYMKVEYELRSMHVFYCDKLEQASLACTSLILLYESIYHSNFTSCNWNKYKLGNLSNDLVTLHKDLLRKLNVYYCSCLAIHAGFKAASEWLKVSQLEKTLPNLKKINEQIETINQLTSRILNELQKEMSMTDWLQYVSFFKHIDLPEIKTTKEDVAQAKATLNENNFTNTFDDSIDVIYDNIQKRKRIENEN